MIGATRRAFHCTAAALTALAAFSTTASAESDLERALLHVRDAEQRRVETFATAAAAVVCIFADSSRAGGGSGVIIDERGYGLTNFHVVQEFIETRRGVGGLSDGRLYPLKVLGVDPGGDIVLFKLSGKSRFDAAPLGDSDELRVGQWVAAMGNPFLQAEDFTPTITLGVISGLHRYQEGEGNLLEYADCIQVSTSINPGNSGGPLFDMRGRVVGINGRASFEERGRVNVGLGYAVSINQIKRFLPSLRAGRLVEHGTLGATTRLVNGRLVIDAIQEFSAAERAGIALGDELLAIAGRRLATPNDYNNLIAILPARWPVTLRLRRDGEVFETRTRLDRLPLRLPMLYVVDLEHNHAELERLLAEFRTVWRTRAPDDVTSVEWRGTVKCGDQPPGDWRVRAARPAARFAFERSEPTDAASALDALRDEWVALCVPLIAPPAIDLQWEFVGGDEVAGRIVNVVERRFAGGERVLWKFAVDDRELLGVEFLDRDERPVATWTPESWRSFDEFRWP
ncbi:MAG: PDZ domain-containing protein, partial [Planctomycetota bacterium]